jgi:hypothetical protein
MSELNISFYGNPLEAATFIRDFEDITTYKGLAGNKKLAAFALCLKGAARDWHDGLPREVRDNWDRLRDRFLEVYKPRQETLWAKERDLYHRHQAEDMPVLSFISGIAKEARELRLRDEQLINLIIGGLRPGIRSYVLDREPRDMDQLLEAASRAEARLAEPHREHERELHKQIKALSAKVDSFTAAAEVTQGSVTLHDHASSKAISDLTMAMEKLAAGLNGTPNVASIGARSAEQHRQRQYEGQQQYQQQPYQQQAGYYHQQPQAGYHQQQQYEPQQYGDQQPPFDRAPIFRGHGRGRGRGRGQYNTSTVGPCYKCGKFGHLQRYCITDICQLCGQSGHTAIACSGLQTRVGNNPFSQAINPFSGYQQQGPN